MLVLSRKQGETISIGEKIVVMVQRLSGNRVSIGIEAPHDCRIVRGELLPLIDAIQTDAAIGSADTSCTLPRRLGRLA